MIKHVKVSIKFDNAGEGKARISIRIISTSSPASNDLRFYLLIKNDENPVKFDKFASEYNKHLDTEKFREVAGAYGLEPAKCFNHCRVFKIGRFPEEENLEGRMAVHPENVTCRQVGYRSIPGKLKKEIGRKDVLLEVKVENVGTVLQEASEVLGESYVWIFQFRTFLLDFIPKETLECWKFSSRSWSVEYNMHKKRGYEDLINYLNQEGLLRYPSSVELWFTIPHSHLFLASSPAHETAIRLNVEDIRYKTEEVDEFESRKGVYAVKIVNRSGRFVEFSVLCVSPFLPDQEPEKLRRDINEFQKEKESFIKWENMITPLTLLVGILALVFGIINVFIVRMTASTEIAESGEIVPDLLTIIIAAVFFGLGVWGVAMPVHLLFSNKLKWEVRPSDKCFAVSIIIVVVMLIMTFFLSLMNSN